SPGTGTPGARPATPAPGPSGGAGGTAGADGEKAARTVREAAEKAGVRPEDIKDVPKPPDGAAAGRPGDGKADRKNEKPDGEKNEKANGDRDGKPDGDKDGGKRPFPCPTPDPEALANAELDPGAPLLPDAPWRLESSTLTLRGLDYHGIVEVKTWSGRVKKVLKFTAEETDIVDLHQSVEGPLGTTGHVRARAGSKSTIRGGTVTMYTEEISGKLFGFLPVTFSPRTPPPLNIPLAVFTDAKVIQAGQFGGTLHVPGMRLYNTAR
ncbi:hypothetical protein ACSNOD_29705, partial [Streptomyces sp. URMC 123]